MLQEALFVRELVRVKDWCIADSVAADWFLGRAVFRTGAAVFSSESAYPVATNVAFAAVQRAGLACLV